MVSIAVVGSAQRSVPAERGAVRTRVRAVGIDRETVTRAAAEAHARLVGNAEQLMRSGGATGWTADQVTTSADRHAARDAAEPLVSYAATGAVAVTFSDFDALATWITELGVLGLVEIAGIDWIVTAATRATVTEQVRAEAVADARVRASTYAVALGLESVEVLGLYEPGLHPASGGARGEWVAQARAMSSRSHDEFAVRPDDIDIAATVTAIFEAS